MRLVEIWVELCFFLKTNFCVCFQPPHETIWWGEIESWSITDAGFLRLIPVLTFESLEKRKTTTKIVRMNTAAVVEVQCFKTTHVNIKLISFKMVTVSHFI